MPVTNYNYDYTNRQVDLELLQTIEQPGFVPVVISNVYTEPKIVTGIQKAIQRYVVLLLTLNNDVGYDPELGSDFLGAIMRGEVSNAGYLKHLFGIANFTVLQQLAADDDNESFGPTYDDERIVSATLSDVHIDYAKHELILTIEFLTGAGDNVSYVFPVNMFRGG